MGRAKDLAEPHARPLKMLYLQAGLGSNTPAMRPVRTSPELGP
jgi:hypothetical protein